MVGGIWEDHMVEETIVQEAMEEGGGYGERAILSLLFDRGLIV